MTPAEIDIWRMAKLMVDRFGEDAATHAAMNSGKFLEEGDVDGAKVWARIVRAVEELQRVTPDELDASH